MRVWWPGLDPVKWMSTLCPQEGREGHSPVCGGGGQSQAQCKSLNVEGAISGPAKDPAPSQPSLSSRWSCTWEAGTSPWRGRAAGTPTGGQHVLSSRWWGCLVFLLVTHSVYIYMNIIYVLKHFPKNPKPTSCFNARYFAGYPR